MKSVIIGAGTYGEVYLAYLQDAGVEVIGFLDDTEEKQGTMVRGVSVIGKIADLPHMRKDYGVEAVYCPLGNNAARVKFLEYAKSLGYETPSFIHPSSTIHHSVKIGQGVYILIGANIMPYTVLEDYVMISMNALVAHHTTLKKGTFLSTGVNFGASIVAHERAYVGIGATIMTGLHNLGTDCLVGAGAVVIKDVPDKAIMAGVPAKVIRIKE
ncbi:MAG: NeuD/PglB/VioB family sugar acetyltransferase [Muribaculaceae bacterium]|nr:NeuD/PglB/VioB family sugar acetyltransferase [Muribaculaceae bacterium]